MSEDDAAGDDPAAFHDRLDEVEEGLDAAETEADLDEIEATLDDLEEELEAATFPEPPEPEEDEDEDEDEAPPDPRDELEDRLGDARDRLEDQRGPYAADVIQAIEGARATVQTTEWAEEGTAELAETVGSFVVSVEETLDTELPGDPDTGVDSLVELHTAAVEAVEAADLDPDDDAGTIADLLDATAELEAGVEDATAFGDLPVREQLDRREFFDILGHYKDFPPEWSAIKAHEDERNAEMILLAYDLLDSNFLEEHCLEALRRLGDERALDPMVQQARRRDHQAIAVIGAIGSDEPLEMLLEYIEDDNDERLRQVSLRAIGEIGSSEATEAVAQQLATENPRVRSGAARALGLIGDPRAVEPLAGVLAKDDAEPVRGSAAWALIQIGTEAALDHVRPLVDDGAPLVEAESTKLADTAEPTHGL